MQKLINLFIVLGLLVAIFIVYLKVRHLDFLGVKTAIETQFEKKNVDTETPTPIERSAGTALLEFPCGEQLACQIFRSQCFKDRCQLEVRTKTETGQHNSFLVLEGDYVPAGSVDRSTPGQAVFKEANEPNSTITVLATEAPLGPSFKGLMIRTISWDAEDDTTLVTYSHVVILEDRLIRSWAQTDLSGLSQVEMKDTNGDGVNEILYSQPTAINGQNHLTTQIFSWSIERQKMEKTSESAD